MQHQIITKGNSEAVFFLTANVIEAPKLRVRYTSCSRLQIHHPQQASTKHFLLWRESNINKDRFNFLLLGAVVDSMKKEGIITPRVYIEARVKERFKISYLKCARFGTILWREKRLQESQRKYIGCQGVK